MFNRAFIIWLLVTGGLTGCNLFKGVSPAADAAGFSDTLPPVAQGNAPSTSPDENIPPGEGFVPVAGAPADENIAAVARSASAELQLRPIVYYEGE